MRYLLLTISLCLFATSAMAQQPGTLKSFYKIDVVPGSALADTPALWRSLGFGGCMVHDADGDGNPELMVVSSNPSGRGIIHQTRLNADGSAKRGFRYFDMNDVPGSVHNIPSQYFGLGFRSMCNLGDLDGNGYDDIAVGNPGGNGLSKGELFVYFMNASGGFDSLKQIRENALPPGTLTLPDRGGFGVSPARIGDLDGDGVPEIAVGQSGYDTSRGQLWILFMHKDGRVKSWKTIGSGTPNFKTLLKNTSFSFTVAGIGDLNRDGIPDVMAAAPGMTTATNGVVWTLFLNADGTVKGYKEYIPGTADLPDAIQNNSYFANAIDGTGDLDGDSVRDVAIGHPGYSDGTTYNSGRVWIWLMNTDGSIKARQFIDRTNGSLPALANRHSLGFAVFRMGDFNKDGIPDVAAGAPGDDMADASDSDRNSGAIYLLNLNGVPVTTGIGDIIRNTTTSFYAYPNPTSTRLVIRSKQDDKLISAVSITDGSGRVVQNRPVNGRLVAIDVSNLPPGNYYLQVRQKDGDLQIIQFIKK